LSIRSFRRKMKQKQHRPRPHKIEELLNFRPFQLKVLRSV
jgi:hypothetical protein